MHDVGKLNAFLELGRSGRRPMGVCCSIYSPEIAEMVGHAGFEWLLINQEHTLISGAHAVSNMVRAADVNGLVSFVKLPKWDPVFARDAMDAGAYGVQVPFVHNAQMLREAITSLRYPPFGTRGYCDVSRAMRYNYNDIEPAVEKNHWDFINRHALVIPYIESVEAVRNLDELIAVEECPIYSLGVSDLAMMITDRAKLQETVLDITKRIHAAGKMVMSFIAMPRHETAPSIVSTIKNLGIDFPLTSEMQCMYSAFELSRRIRDQSLTNAT